MEPEPSGLARRQQFPGPTNIDDQKETTMFAGTPFTNRLHSFGINRSRLRTSALALLTALTLATAAGGALPAGSVQEAAASPASTEVLGLDLTSTQPNPQMGSIDFACVSDGTYVRFLEYSVVVPTPFCSIDLGAGAYGYI
jgi:hypothetical protein